MNPEETQVGRCATAQPLHFVLFDGERDLAGSGITADQANLAACHVIEHCRKVARRGAWMTGADDQLACQQILERFQRRVGASNADIMIDGRRSEMHEFRRVVPEPLRIAEQRVKQRIEHGAVLQRANHRAVPRRDIEQMRGRRVAAGARHVRYHHRGIAGDMLGHMPRQEPRVNIVAAAGGRADEHCDLLTLVKLRDCLLRARGLGRQRSEDRNACKAAPHARNHIRRQEAEKRFREQPHRHDGVERALRETR